MNDQAATAWAAEADLGLTEADLARARSVLRGYLADAEIDKLTRDINGQPRRRSLGRATGSRGTSALSETRD